MLILIIGLIIVGLFLASLEILMPGTIWGTIGATLLITAVVLAYKFGDVWMGAVAFGSVIGLLCGILGLGYLVLPKLNWAKKFFNDAAKQGRSVIVHDGQPIMGKTGVVHKVLKPGGSIEIEGIRYKAVSEDGVLEEGTPVVVTGHSLARLLVKRVSSSPSQAA